MIKVARLRPATAGGPDVGVVDLTVHDGELVALVDSGSGAASTILSCLAGLVRHHGEATIDGRRYRDLASPTHQVGAALGLAAPPVPGGRLLRRRAALLGLDESRVSEVASLTGLDALSLRRRADRLPRGQRRRLSLALALLPAPSTLLLERPTDGLDPDEVRSLGDLLGHHVDEGGSVLLSLDVAAEAPLLGARPLLLPPRAARAGVA